MKTIITTQKAPAPIDPFNQAVMVNDLLFISGQIPINHENGELVLDDIKAETRQVMENLKAILNEGQYDI